MLHVWGIVGRCISRWNSQGELIETRTTPSYGSAIVPIGGGEMVWRESKRGVDRTDMLFLRVRSDGGRILKFARIR